MPVVLHLVNTAKLRFVPILFRQPYTMPPTSPSSTTLQTPRDRLLDGAVELFAARGYQAIGLRDLAGHLGIRAGSLYHHFESKQSLLFELIEATLSDLLFGTRQQLKRAHSATDALHIFIKAFVWFRRNTPQRITVALREQINLSSGQRVEIDRLMRAYKKELHGIALALDRRTSAARAPAGFATEAVIMLLFAEADWWSMEIDEHQLAELLGRFAHRILIEAQK